MGNFAPALRNSQKDVRRGALLIIFLKTGKFKMFIPKGRELIVIVLVAIITLTGLAALLFLKPEANTVMAQEEGGSKPDKTSNYNAMQEEIKYCAPDDIRTTSFNAPAGEKPGERVSRPPQDEVPNWAYSSKPKEGRLEGGGPEGVISGRSIAAGEETSRRHPPANR
jgi:hypothetical protein